MVLVSVYSVSTSREGKVNLRYRPFKSYFDLDSLSILEFDVENCSTNVWELDSDDSWIKTMRISSSSFVYLVLMPVLRLKNDDIVFVTRLLHRRTNEAEVYRSVDFICIVSGQRVLVRRRLNAKLVYRMLL